MDGRRTTMEYAKNIHFKYYDSDNQLVSIANLLMEEASGFSMCNPDEKFAIIVHGWKESCETEWVPWMISNLTVFRGGCIICMDYGGYASADRYLRLFRQFDPITEILAGKLRPMEAMGFNLGQGFIFGFSYGGHVAVEASKRVGVRRLEAIDICDIAGPAFDFRRAHIDHRNAARNVQCIHTSRDKGSRHTTTCHQNWKMGTCGWFQTAAADPPKGSHGLCPYFYLSAFSNDFLAVPKPMGCMARKPARYWPEGFRMGYREPRNDNQLVSIANLLMEEASGFSMCNPDEKFAIIVHGWKESCETEWVPWMISNLTVFRGGCIICMDYGGYASADRYLRLFRQFDPITEILAGKLRLMEAMGFNLGQGFIFGFSYGGHVAVEASKRVGVRRLEAIDICDIAGPAFDFRRAHIDHRNAARNVQCIHTSRDKGSRHTTTCHQNWKMGTCGWFQTAAADPPKILAGKLRLMEAMGFNLGQGFIFGFSYGGHVAVEASKRVGVRRLEAIDICDIAGPAFDFRRAHIDHRNAARNVQCIHTSRDKGSRHTTTCHQNWKMGTCGWFQTAAADPPKGSHGLCPYFYLSAFSNDFLAVPKPMGCMARKPARYWPEGFRMGYREPRKWQVQGELFALTTKEYPFTSNATEMNALDFFPMLASETEHTEMDIDFFVETTKKP
uniref:Lipase domain-containing protein n=1 Tax=Lutzomyia longipalpis TaxID=7200 RepID=A0A1B0CRY6_LUTLO